MSIQKRLPEQKLLEILESCKQIPKDDRLLLRKSVREGDSELIQILSQPTNKRLQIRLRKHVIKQKQNKKSELCQRKLNTKPNTPYRSPAHSQEKMKKSLEIYRHLLEFKETLCDKITAEKNTNQGKEINRRKTIQGSSNNSRIRISSTLNDQPDTDRVLSPQETLYTPPELFDWEGFKSSQKKIPLSEMKSNQSSKVPSPRLNPSFVPKNLNFQLPTVTDKKSPGEEIYSIKMALIKHFAEDIFDQVVRKHFPVDQSETCVYLPYRKFLEEVLSYLKQRGEEVALITETTMNIPVLEPFGNQFQGATLKTIGAFLEKFCLRKNGDLRNLFIVMDTQDEGAITLEKFRRINSWKGEPLLQSFENVVRKWGNCNQISFWQMYRARREKECESFRARYSQA